MIFTPYIMLHACAWIYTMFTSSCKLRNLLMFSSRTRARLAPWHHWPREQWSPNSWKTSFCGRDPWWISGKQSCCRVTRNTETEILVCRAPTLQINLLLSFNTKFLALDKCLPDRKHIYRSSKLNQSLQGRTRFNMMNEEWLAITRRFNWSVLPGARRGANFGGVRLENVYLIISLYF